MNPRTGIVSLVVFLVPVEVQIPAETAPVDSSAARPRVFIDLIGGGGSYSFVPRSCSGQQVGSAVGVPYEEISGGIHVTDDAWQVGVRAGRLRTKAERGGHDVTYFNPYGAIASKYAGVGIGLFTATDPMPMSEGDTADEIPVSAHIWLGGRRGNLRVSFMESAPLVAGGGYLRVGMHLMFRERDALFVGTSIEPFDSLGFAADLDLAVSRRVSLLTRGRLGSGGGRLESGLALGLRWDLTTP